MIKTRFKATQKSLLKLNDIVILYHKNCTDGFSGAWAAFQKFGGRASYIPIEHNTPPPAGLLGKEIYMIDITFDMPVMKGLIRNNRRVTAIDHHISRKNEVALTYKPLFSNGHSGAVLAWMYFFPGKPAPRLLRHVEDEDIWKFKLPYTREVSAILDLADFDFAVWSRLVRDFEKPPLRRKHIADGKLLLKYQNSLIERLVRHNAQLINFMGIKTLAVNSPNFESEIGNVLRRKLPPMGIVWREKGNRRTFSLRSDSSCDVSKLAGKFGGGGHKKSAGFGMPLSAKLPWKRL